MAKNHKKRLSAFAEAVLADHRKAPEKPFYDLDLLGSSFSGSMLEKLDRAYQELEEADLVERSGRFVRYFDDIKALYVLSKRARGQVKAA